MTRSKQAGKQGSEEGLEEATGTVFDNMLDDSYVLVWRRSEQSKRMVYMGRLAPSEATEEVIQRALGGGQYLCKEKVPNEDGSNMVFGRSRQFELGGPRKPNGTLETVGSLPQTFEASPAVTPTGPGGQPINKDDIMSAGLLQLFQANKEVSAMQMQAFQTMASRPQTDIGAIIASLAPIVTALITRPPAEKVDVLAIVEKVTEMVKTNTSPANSFKEQVEMMNEVLDLKERTTAPVAGDEPDSLMAVVSQHLGKLLDIIQQGQRKGPPKRGPVNPLPPGPPASPALSPAPPAVPAAAGSPAAPDTEPAWHRVVDPWRKNLIGLARIGKDADTTARFLFMVASDANKGIIREFMVGSPDPTGDLIAFIPDLQPYENWVEEFVTEIADGLGLLGEDEPQEPVVVLKEEPSVPVLSVAERMAGKPSP